MGFGDLNVIPPDIGAFFGTAMKIDVETNPDGAATCVQLNDADINVELLGFTGITGVPPSVDVTAGSQIWRPQMIRFTVSNGRYFAGYFTFDWDPSDLFAPAAEVISGLNPGYWALVKCQWFCALSAGQIDYTGGFERVMSGSRLIGSGLLTAASVNTLSRLSPNGINNPVPVVFSQLDIPGYITAGGLLKPFGRAFLHGNFYRRTEPK
jgi:hypothetical protein